MHHGCMHSFLPFATTCRALLPCTATCHALRPAMRCHLQCTPCCHALPPVMHSLLPCASTCHDFLLPCAVTCHAHCLHARIAGGRVLKRKANAEGGIENGYNIQADSDPGLPGADAAPHHGAARSPGGTGGGLSHIALSHTLWTPDLF